MPRTCYWSCDDTKKRRASFSVIDESLWFTPIIKWKFIGVKRVVQAIQLLVTHTQNNSVPVDQASAFAASLSGQAHQLVEQIARFKVT